MKYLVPAAVLLILPNICLGQEGRLRSRMQQSDPNASGNHNQGGFDASSFFRPGMTYPGGQAGGMQPQSGNLPGVGPQAGQVYPQQNYRPSYQPSVSRYPDPPVAPKKTYSRLPIRIRCWDQVTGTCEYELVTASGKAFPYRISAGREQSLTETTHWTFRYRPTMSSGYRSYRLRGGRTYELRKYNNAWQLYMVP